MKLKIYGVALLLLALVALSVAGFVYLYVQMQGSDSRQQQDKAQLLIFKLRQVNANLDADVLKSYMGQQKDYDAIGASSKELSGHLEQLRAESAPFASGAAADALKELDRVVKEKSAMIERFMRANAILKNSLRYLPVAQEELGSVMGNGPGGDTAKLGKLGDHRSAVNQLVSTVMQYSLFPDDRLAAAAQSQNEALRLTVGSSSPETGEKLRNLVKHVDVILTERSGVAQLVTKVGDMSISPQLNILASEVSRGVTGKTTRQVQYGQYLYVYLAALLLVFASVTVTLARAWSLAHQSR